MSNDRKQRYFGCWRCGYPVNCQSETFCCCRVTAITVVGPRRKTWTVLCFLGYILLWSFLGWYWFVHFVSTFSSLFFFFLLAYWFCWRFHTQRVYNLRLTCWFLFFELICYLSIFLVCVRVKCTGKNKPGTGGWDCITCLCLKRSL